MGLARGRGRSLRDGGRPFIGAFDPFAGQLYAVLGPNRALSSYSGPCWRVRRSIDGAEVDIGFDAQGWADKAALVTASGGGNLSIAIDYDKTGQGHHGAQASVTSQPRCALAGVVDVGANGHPCALYDGVNDYLEVQNALGFSRDASALTMAAITRATGAGTQPAFTTQVAASTSIRAILSYTSATIVVAQGRQQDGFALGTATSSTSSGAWSALVSRARYAQGFMDLSVNGGAVNTGPLSGGLPQNTPDTDSFSAPRIGATAASSAFFAGSIGTLPISRSALDITALNAALAQVMP